MSFTMAITRGFLWLDTRGGRRALSRPDAASHVDPSRKPAELPHAVRERFDVTTSTAAGMPLTTIAPRDKAPTAEVVYLHGGGYVSPIGAHHWWLIDHIARLSGARITVPHYPLAPEHTLDDALPMLEALYADAVARAAEGRLVLAGDSAGGGLALAVAIRAREESLRPVDRLLLYAPFLDATLSDPAAERLERKDPILRCVGARDDGRAWAGARTPTDPLVSPLYGDLRGLPPITIIQGDRDILLPDVETFTNKARDAGTDVDLLVEPGGFHVYPIAFWTPEARRAHRISAGAILS